MFIQACAVEIGKTVCVSWKMCRYPVQNNADVRLMHLVHKIHEIFCAAVTRRRRIVTDHLISPGTVKRMFHDGHQFDMRIIHFFDIFNDLRRQLAIIQIRSVVFRLSEGAEIQFVYTDGRIHLMQFFTLLHPLFIFPVKPVNLPDYGSRFGTKLLSESIRIRFEIGNTAFGFQFKLIAVSFFYTRYKNLKHTGIPEFSHLMHPAIPAVKISDSTDADRIRRPNGKVNARNAIDRHRMRTQFLIYRIMDACVKLLGIFLRDLRLKIVGVFHLLQCTVFKFGNIFIGKSCFAGDQCRKIPFLIHTFHLIALIARLRLYTHLLRSGDKSLYQNVITAYMRA